MLAQGKLAEAETVARQALEIKRRVLGEEHPSTLIAKDNLVDFLRVQGKSKEVRSLVTELIAAKKRAAERPDAGPDALNEYAWLLLTCEPRDLRDSQSALAQGPVEKLLAIAAIALSKKSRLEALSAADQSSKEKRHGNSR